MGAARNEITVNIKGGATENNYFKLLHWSYYMASKAMDPVLNASEEGFDFHKAKLDN